MLENWAIEGLSGKGCLELLTHCPGRTWHFKPMPVKPDQDE